MAYTVNEYRIQIRGSFTGGEIWNHTWAVLDVTGGQDINDAGAIFNLFYEDLAAFSQFSTDWSAVGATAKNLNTGVTTELTWSLETGVGTSSPLPPQLAIRVSLTGTGPVHGGPFINGWASAALDASGQLDPSGVTNLITALETLTSSLTGAGFALRIDRPTVDQTVGVVQGRIGERFDVIRKRANALPEAYVTFDVS